MSNLMNTVKKSSRKELKTDSLTKPQYSAISEHSSVKGTPTAIRGWLMSLPPDSLASPSQSQESNKEKTTSATCGPKLSTPFALYDPNTPYLKTCQVCLLTNTQEPYLETWPKAGIYQDGAFYRLPKWERRINEIESLLLPTPSTNDSCSGKDRPFNLSSRSQMDRSLTKFAQQWPTPAARDYRGQHAENSEAFEERKNHSRGVNLCEEMQRRGHAGQLNPMWVEWLMNWPLNWTSLEPLPYENYELWKKASTTQVQRKREGLQSLWWHKEPSATSQRSRHEQQQPGEYRDSMRDLSRQDARPGAMGESQERTNLRELSEDIHVSEGEAENMQQELWEQIGVEVTRVANGVENRVQRLKALGNGQVPAVVRTAWRLLSD